MIDVCRKCTTVLTDDNWQPALQKRHDCICRECNRVMKIVWREKNRIKIRAVARHQRKEHPEKARAKSERDTRRRGVVPYTENKECSSYLGIGIAEEVLYRVFKDVVRMPMNNHGFDFVCNKGKRIDVKSSCIREAGGWKFTIRRNHVADFFLCIAFDNRTDLNPLHLWLIPSHIVNYKTNAGISLSSLHK